MIEFVDVNVKDEQLGNIVIPSGWFDFLLNYSDIFRTDYCGYWMCGVARSKEDATLGWLVYEHNEELAPEGLEERAEELWKTRQSLPEGFFILNEEKVIEAYLIGLKKWGEDWYENADAISYDVVLQIALLKEIVYG